VFLNLENVEHYTAPYIFITDAR